MKLFGKRGKAGGMPAEGDPRYDPRSNYAIAPLQRQPPAAPATTTPLADQLTLGGPGVTDGYIVLPRALAEQMPLPWQRQAAGVLAQFHHTHRELPWPRYRVLPSREENLTDLDEEQLAEAGYVVELDANGELVYLERSGRKVENPQQTKVMVTCLDAAAAAAPEPEPRRRPAQETAAPPGVRPAPMNIGPQPVWQVVSPTESSPAEAAHRAESSTASDDTPPRGVPAPGAPADPGAVDWFADTGRRTEPPASFGPTGEPIERPYRPRD